jgi:hypothetical protein
MKTGKRVRIPNVLVFDTPWEVDEFELAIEALHATIHWLVYRML